jgi:hypothetical protein
LVPWSSYVLAVLQVLLAAGGSLLLFLLLLLGTPESMAYFPYHIVMAIG